MTYFKISLTTLIILITVSVLAAPPKDTPMLSASTQDFIQDNDTYIDANKILMFITNHGGFGRDFGQIFGHFWGTYYPYIGTEYIEGGVLTASPLYGSGLWLGGKVGQEIRVAIAGYDTEYYPGPMAEETYQPFDPDFRVYKLYHDSMASNPNYDYLHWPIDQGAPLDEFGNPLLRGHQTLWTVFNDAYPPAHTNDAGETDPLGIEVRLLAWAQDEAGSEVIPGSDRLAVTQVGSENIDVIVTIVDPGLLNGHDYKIDVTSDATHCNVWQLTDLTDAEVLVSGRPWDQPYTVDGFEVVISLAGFLGYESFEVVANASGPLETPLPGALASAGFPTPGDADPGDDQQVGNGKWLFHVADLSGTCGSYTCFEDYQLRIATATGCYDYEMRFTGSNDNPGVNGGYAVEWYTLDDIWVPFEIWRTGINTPDDESDDVRLVPAMIDASGDGKFALEHWSTDPYCNCGDLCEHSVSDGADDPFTDRTYWLVPEDDSPGQAGYLAAEAEIRAGTYSPSLSEGVVMYRGVLVNWDAGELPPFDQTCPEQGTIFRIRTLNEAPEESFTFTATPHETITTGDQGVCVYLEYWIHNKGVNQLDGCYISLWSDPDLGGAGDDFVGCDTLNNIHFCYNADNTDAQYGSPPPAMGFKYLVGPIVPSTGQTANLHGVPWEGHEDIGMTAFVKYINGTDPDNADETYGYMRGLTKTGDPYVYNSNILTYVHSGDPVLGTGDLDFAPADRRMMASSGPFNFAPGDSAYLLVRFAAKHGATYLDAITELKRVLNLPFDMSTSVAGTSPDEVPNRFTVRQNYPNPFNPSTTIMYSLPERARVTIDVYNVLGQRVKRLVDKTQPAGNHSVVWNGDDDSGNAVATGFYFYRVKADDMIDYKKMLLLK